MNRGFNFQQPDIFATKKMVGDLGFGVYTYCADCLGENGSNLWNPRENALKFAQRYRSASPSDVRVLCVKIKDTDGLSVLDLNNAINQVRFDKIRKDLDYRAKQLYEKIHPGGAKERNNKDGLILELAFQRNALDRPDVIVKQTFTAFFGPEISNFNNGEELVIRNPEIVVETTYSIKKEEA